MDEVGVIIFTDEKTNTWGFPCLISVELEFDNLGSLTSAHPLYSSYYTASITVSQSKASINAWWISTIVWIKFCFFPEYRL